MRISLGALLALGSVSLLALAAAIWPWLPPVNQDEYLPLLGMSWFTKEPAARPSILSAYLVRVLGRVVPGRAYPYVGSLKGLLYAATGLPATVPIYRATNLVLVWLLVCLMLWVTWRISRASRIACLACLAFLLTDTSLIVLGITDEGPIAIGLVLGMALVALLTVTPRWWHVAPITLVVFLGVWDRINFLWFVAAALAGSAAAMLAGPLREVPRRLIAMSLGCALGIAGVWYLVPGYLNPAITAKGISLGDTSRLWSHWLMLLGLLDPFAAYHRYINFTGSGTAGRWVYRAYRWSFSLVMLSGIAGSLGLGIWRLRRDRSRAAAPLFLGTFLASLLFLIVKTDEAWASHHIVLVKPFVYLTFGCVVAELATLRRGAIALAAVLVLGFGYAGVRGYVDLQRAPCIFGIYDVSWNQTEAWQAAARSRVPAVFTLDWGVFYPGVVNSRASQRWEMTEVDGPERLLSLNFGRSAPEIGLLFRAAGPHRWLLGAANDGQTYSVVEQALFDRHPGEKWVFLVVNTAGRRQVGPVPEAPVDNLVRNPLFRQGELYWRYEKWEKEPGRVDYDIVPCDGGPEQTCARLKHPVEGDSRLVQEIELPADSVYEVSALAKATGVGEASKGAYLCLMDGLAESGELRGDTDWHQLRFYVATRDRPRRIRLAARLGTFGQVNVGSAWFTDLRVQRVAAAPPGAKVYDLARGS